MQVEANQDGGIQEAVGGSRVDQRLHENGRLARDEDVHEEGEVAGGGEGEGRGGKGEGAAQPGSYWLGREFFGSSAIAAAAAAAAEVWGFGSRFQGSGKGPWGYGKPGGE